VQDGDWSTLSKPTFSFFLQHSFIVRQRKEAFDGQFRKADRFDGAARMPIGGCSSGFFCCRGEKILAEDSSIMN
jgi:hypothetical protein